MGMFFANCEGPTGPAGPQGEKGDPGENIGKTYTVTGTITNDNYKPVTIGDTTVIFCTLLFKDSKTNKSIKVGDDWAYFLYFQAVQGGVWVGPEQCFKMYMPDLNAELAIETIQTQEEMYTLIDYGRHLLGMHYKIVLIDPS